MPLLFGGSLPPLRSVMFDGGFLLCHHIPFYANLQLLHLENLFNDSALSLEDLFLVFNTATLLVELRFMFVECVDFGDSDLSSLVLPHLTTLFFVPVDSSSSRFLARLDLPSVRLLYLEIYDSAHIDYLAQHCGPLLERVETVFLKV
ncbi:hypothetical protein C8J57DRAFT_1521076 [Mycena rebaudengoi]|nr:hypothetical protein C8J57DRAFT_1521076 [Mycena rebaudengoi]